MQRLITTSASSPTLPATSSLITPSSRPVRLVSRIKQALTGRASERQGCSTNRFSSGSRLSPACWLTSFRHSSARRDSSRGRIICRIGASSPALAGAKAS